MALNTFSLDPKEKEVERHPTPKFIASQAPSATSQDDPQTPISDVTRVNCLRFAQRQYPTATIIEPQSQGRCSYTLLVPDDGHNGTIIQFRPPRHRIDLCITAAAETIFGTLVPHTEFLTVLTPRRWWCCSSSCSCCSYCSTASYSYSSTSSSPSSLVDYRPTHHATSRNSGSDQELSPLWHSCRTLPNSDQPSAKAKAGTDGGAIIVYKHSLLPGTPLSTFLLPLPLTQQQQQQQQQQQPPRLDRVVRALARRYFAPSYRAALPPDSPRLPPAKRAVGWTLRRVAARLAADLSKPPFPKSARSSGAEDASWRERGERCRAAARRALAWLGEIEAGLPWALTHGDFIGAGNVLVSLGDGEDGDEIEDNDQRGDKDASGGRKGQLTLTGLVDWAEGEWLPFGVGLYGLEEVLGRTVTVEETGERRFEYLPDAERLRAVFWEELAREVPALAPGSELRERVEKARVLGLLLWYGIAFDDGALNRVAQPGRDDEELQKLDLFLSGHNDSNATPEENGILG
ncbi:hypothetical protein C7999DRAFT_31840 [Corynascus novoguineensis]|uniref:Aminoglycoside phosphotransferase domain-containing protein n=1 Tax=Corynascus novoguineensis TaxID=1126955 RepID=A0AAN7CVP9_9PEZI|nr:hypothetical protein C7999DRAFT_31840 [Corynascus novoguineensis]